MGESGIREGVEEEVLRSYDRIISTFIMAWGSNPEGAVEGSITPTPCNTRPRKRQKTTRERPGSRSLSTFTFASTL